MLLRSKLRKDIQDKDPNTSRRRIVSESDAYLLGTAIDANSFITFIEHELSITDENNSGFSLSPPSKPRAPDAQISGAMMLGGLLLTEDCVATPMKTERFGVSSLHEELEAAELALEKDRLTEVRIQDSKKSAAHHAASEIAKTTGNSPTAKEESSGGSVLVASGMQTSASGTACRPKEESTGGTASGPKEESAGGTASELKEESAGGTAAEPKEECAGDTASERKEVSPQGESGGTASGLEEESAGGTASGLEEESAGCTASELMEENAGGTASGPEEDSAGGTASESELKEENAGGMASGPEEDSSGGTASELKEESPQGESGGTASGLEEESAGGTASELNEENTGGTASGPEEDSAGGTASELKEENAGGIASRPVEDSSGGTASELKEKSPRGESVLAATGVQGADSRFLPKETYSCIVGTLASRTIKTWVKACGFTNPQSAKDSRTILIRHVEEVASHKALLKAVVINKLTKQINDSAVTAELARLEIPQKTQATARKNQLLNHLISEFSDVLSTGNSSLNRTTSNAGPKLKARQIKRLRKSFNKSHAACEPAESLASTSEANLTKKQMKRLQRMSMIQPFVGTEPAEFGLNSAPLEEDHREEDHREEDHREEDHREEDHPVEPLASISEAKPPKKRKKKKQRMSMNQPPTGTEPEEPGLNTVSREEDSPSEHKAAVTSTNTNPKQNNFDQSFEKPLKLLEANLIKIQKNVDANQHQLMCLSEDRTNLTRTRDTPSCGLTSIEMVDLLERVKTIERNGQTFLETLRTQQNTLCDLGYNIDKLNKEFHTTPPSNKRLEKPLSPTEPCKCDQMRREIKDLKVQVGQLSTDNTTLKLSSDAKIKSLTAEKAALAASLYTAQLHLQLDTVPTKNPKLKKTTCAATPTLKTETYTAQTQLDTAPRILSLRIPLSWTSGRIHRKHLVVG